MIYKLQRESTAQSINRQLPRLWNSINHLVVQLRDTGRDYTTNELYSLRNGFISTYTVMNDFNTTNGTWYASRYPEFATGLTGALSSLQSINTIIMNGLENYYWDAELDVPVITNISQAHRDALANSIESELEE